MWNSRAPAGKYYRQALALNPHQHDSLRYLADYETANKKYRKSIKYLDRLAALQTETSWVFANRGNVLKNLKKYKLALKDYQKAISLNSNNIWNYYNTGLIYTYNLKNYKLGIREFSKGIAINPNEVWFYYNRANALYYEAGGNPGKLNSALEDYKRALELDRKNKSALEMTAWIYSRLRDYDKSIVEYTRLIEMFPRESKYYYLRGLQLQKKDKTQKANGDLKKAAQMGNREARNYLNARH